MSYWSLQENCAHPSIALGSNGRQGLRTAHLVYPHDLGIEACLRLRHDYIIQRKGWLTSDGNCLGLETDRYDPHAWHLAVLEDAGADGGDISKTPPSPSAPVGGDGDAVRVLAYLRVLPWTAPTGFMLDHDFACLVSEEEQERLPRVNAVELSRLVVAPGAGRGGQRGSQGKSPHVVELLLKLLYHLSLQEGIEHYYIVVEKDWLPAFTRRFHIPFRVIGREHTFPDGTRTVAAYATRSELEEAVAAKDAEKYAWYVCL